MSNWIKLGVLSFAILGLLAMGPAQAQGRSQGNGAAGNVVNLRGGQVVPGQYIVVFEDGVADPAAVANDMARTHGLDLGFVYRHALKGFSANIPDGAVAALSRDPRVAFIEADQTVTLFGHTVVNPTGIRRIFAPHNANIDIDGVDDVRIDVDVAVIDTGIDYNHPDLNVVFRTDCTGGPMNQSCSDNSGDDGNGHGTHVAGTIGALDNGDGIVGVAPGARLWAVKVLKNNGSGWLSNVTAGIDFVTAHAADIEVANMSLGCECDSEAMDLAITNSVAAGVTYAVAAGNSAADASTFNPANHPDVITVSALADFNGLDLITGGVAGSTCRVDQDDTLADFSNFGADVEITAPGVCILSTWNGGGSNTISGTSMAAPHVAGAAALLAATDPTLTPADILNALVNAGNFGWTDDSGDNWQEPLLDVSDTGVFAPATELNSEGPPPPVDNPPSVEITSPTEGDYFESGAPVNFTGSANDDFDGDMTGGLAWTSTVNGDLAGFGISGSGGSTTLLSDGPHTITASVTDSGTNMGSASVDITVGPLLTFTVSSVDYDSSGGRNSDKHLSVFVDVDPDVTGTSVSITLTLSGDAFWNGTGTTDEFGVAAFTLKNATAGCYTTVVTDIDGDTEITTPENSFELQGATCL